MIEIFILISIWLAPECSNLFNVFISECFFINDFEEYASERMQHIKRRIKAKVDNGINKFIA